MSVDSIIFEDLKISQPDKGFRFGIDSVILAWFATIKPKDAVIDIGSGSGVLSALLARLRGAKDITAVELQPQSYTHLCETISLNSFSDVIHPVNADLRGFKPGRQFNMAICNPPYRPLGVGKLSKERAETTARFDESLTLGEILQFCRKNLFYGGRLVFTGDADRLTDAVCACRENDFEPKRLSFLYPAADKRPKIFLMECSFGGGKELIVEPPVIQNSENYKKILRGEWD